MYRFIIFFLLFGISSCNILNNQKGTKLFPVKIGEEYGYVDQLGKIVINPQFAEAGLFADGIAIVKSSGKKKGCMDILKRVVSILFNLST